MKNKDLHKTDTKKLKKRLEQLRSQLALFQGKIRAGHNLEKDSGRVRPIRKEIAKILTIIRERGK